MRHALVLILFLLFVSAPAQNKNLMGHWTAVSTADSLLTLDELEHSGTVIFKRIKQYSDKLYQWGGGCFTGMSFGKKGDFAFYHNTLCSTESSPLSHTGDTWEINGQVLFIRGKEKIYKARIISIDKNKLVLSFVK